VSGVTTPGSDRDWEDVDDVSWTLLDLRRTRRRVLGCCRPDDGDRRARSKTRKTDTQLAPRPWLPAAPLRPAGEYHDRTFAEFWREDLGAEAVESGYDWATDHERTIEALESFLTSRRKRKGLADSSIDTLRYRLNRYVAAYCEENGTDDLVTPVAREGDVPLQSS